MPACKHFASPVNSGLFVEIEPMNANTSHLVLTTRQTNGYRDLGTNSYLLVAIVPSLT